MKNRARHRLLVGAAALAVAFPLIALAAPLDLPNEFEEGQTITAAGFNENFDAIAVAVNDNDARITALEEGAMGAAIVPAGAVMFFNLAACPGGWVEMTGLRGRVPLAMPLGGTVGMTQGTELTTDEPTIEIAEVPAHLHGAGTLGGSTSSVAHTHNITDNTGTHAHSISGAGIHDHTVAGNGTHDHDIRVNTGGYGTSSVVGATAAGTPEITASPIQGDGSHTHTIVSGEGDHTHTVSGAGGHDHTMDSPSHSHTLTIDGSTASNAGPDSVDVTMPYMQLLACQKT
ncbi:MAG TPA: hypothetical protein VG755_24795 [Nannocystaceae bacterium]|nr:hypothetical protein [Nannocystaceae bacterium]